MKYRKGLKSGRDSSLKTRLKVKKKPLAYCDMELGNRGRKSFKSTLLKGVLKIIKKQTLLPFDKHQISGNSVNNLSIILNPQP